MSQTEEAVQEQVEDRRRLAEEANRTRNQGRLDRLNAIADSAEGVRQQEVRDAGGEIREVTDEMWSEDPKARKLPSDVPDSEEVTIAKAMRQAQDQDATDEEQAADEDENDEAREAGADDVRITNNQKYYRLIVNGEEVWKTLSEIRADAQKVSSADAYLREASETVRRATALTPPSPSGDDEAVKARKARLREALRRATLGEDEALDELTELISTPSADPADVLKAVDERVDGRLTFRQAVNWFEGEYAEELKNPQLKQYAAFLDTQLSQAEPGLDFKSRLNKVGQQLRSIRGTSKPVSPKLERKASVKPLPQAGGRQRPELDVNEEGSIADDIAAIARGRHQAQPIVHGPRRS